MVTHCSFLGPKIWTLKSRSDAISWVGKSWDNGSLEMLLPFNYTDCTCTLENKVNWLWFSSRRNTERDPRTLWPLGYTEAVNSTTNSWRATLAHAGGRPHSDRPAGIAGQHYPSSPHIFHNLLLKQLMWQSTFLFLLFCYVFLHLSPVLLELSF